MKLRKHMYYSLPYSQENIDRFKSSENMLKYARYNDDTFGWFFVNKKRDELVRYVGIFKYGRNKILRQTKIHKS